MRPLRRDFWKSTHEAAKNQTAENWCDNDDDNDDDDDDDDDNNNINTHTHTHKKSEEQKQVADRLLCRPQSSPRQWLTL